MKLADALLEASHAAATEAILATGTERVRLEELSRILLGEHRVAKQKEIVPLRHMCGAGGFNPWLGDFCEACDARKTA